MFSDRNVYSGGVAMKIYTRMETYAANFPISIDLSTPRARFRSVPIALANPSSEPLDSADITYDGARVPGGCVERLRIEPYSDASVDARTAYATLDPARPPIALSKVIGAVSPLTCKSPYADATIDGVPAQLEYPAMARELGLTGMTLVKVMLAADGAVTGATIYRSSGSSVLDRAAVKAAVATHYRSDLVRCEPEPGSYLFRAEFSTAR
jgi:TonB family protein